jgi:glycerol uptake facilitator-like aquaporin
MKKTLSTITLVILFIAGCFFAAGAVGTFTNQDTLGYLGIGVGFALTTAAYITGSISINKN